MKKNGRKKKEKEKEKKNKTRAHWLHTNIHNEMSSVNDLV